MVAQDFAASGILPLEKLGKRHELFETKEKLPKAIALGRKLGEVMAKSFF